MFVQTCTCRFSTFKYYSRIHQTSSGKVGLKFNLTHHFQTLFIYIVPKFLKFCNQFIINSKKGTMLLFLIYFLLLLSKTKPFFDNFGDNYFFCLLYHAFTPSYMSLSLVGNVFSLYYATSILLQSTPTMSFALSWCRSSFTCT